MFVELNMLMEAGVFESDSGEKGLLAPYGWLKLWGGRACDRRAPGIPGDRTLPCAHMTPLSPGTLRTPFLLLSKPALGKHWPSRWAPQWLGPDPGTRLGSPIPTSSAPVTVLLPQASLCPDSPLPSRLHPDPPHARPYPQGSLPKSRRHICFGKTSPMTPVLETAS